MWDVIAALLVAGVAGAAGLLIFRRITIFDYQHALLFDRGRLRRVLGPGVYWVFRPNQRVEVLDARPCVLTVAGQEVLSADGVSVKVSVLVSYRVSDPKRALAFQSYQDMLYAHVQSVLREAVGEQQMQQLLEARAALSERLRTGCEPVAERLGISLDSVSIKDIMLPGPLKEAFSQVARARQEGLAALEKARGESAAMRNLANAAKLLEGNRALYQLRLLQSVGEAGTVVLRLDDDGSRGCG